MKHSVQTVRRTLYVQQPGAKLGMADGQWTIQLDGAILQQVPGELISQIAVIGNVQITSAAMVYCAEKNVPIHVLSAGGKHVSITPDNGGLITITRQHQYELLHKAERTAFACDVISNKIGNQIAFLSQKKRNKDTVDAQDQKAILQLKALKKQCTPDLTIGKLLGLEGMAAKVYFASWNRCIRNRAFAFTKRIAHPAPDPVNCLLSFGYALLLSSVEAALQIRGVDPNIGMIHRLRNGSSLTCDLMEEFRTPIVDALVLNAINFQTFTPEDFIIAEEEKTCRMQSDARKRFLQCYEERLFTTRLLPGAKEAVSWKEIFDIQALRYKRFVYGKVSKYYPYRLG